MLCETGRCLLCFVLYEIASSSTWGACYLRYSNALSIMWILIFISSHTASSSKGKREYHIWSISSCPGQVGQKNPHQGEISLKILWRQIREGMGVTIGKISLNFSFFSEVMRVSEVLQVIMPTSKYCPQVASSRLWRVVFQDEWETGCILPAHFQLLHFNERHLLDVQTL